MPTSTPPKRPRRRDDPDRAHAFLVNPPKGQYDYDPMHDLPACPDAALNTPWELSSAKLWEGQFREGKLQAQRTRFYPSRGALEGQVRALRESVPSLKSMGYGGLRKVALREAGPEPSDWWSYGLNASPRFGSSTSPYIPLLPGPATRQLYWADYFAMSAKAFEAYQHNPIAHRAVEIHCEFILGRGVEARAKTERGQKIWDAFWQANNMDNRLEEIVGDCGVYGELFLRYFPQPNRTLVVRSLDPAGIYDIITDQEDWESVYFYHQQEQERSQLFAPPGGNIAPTGPTDPGAVTRYTIRQIPASEIDHYRINARSGEVRGRSDLFPALGYLKRLQDLLTSRVVRADMQARMVFDLLVKGTEGDVTTQRNTLFPGGQPPEAGAVLGHNDQVELNAFQFDSTAQTDDGSVDELVTMCALGTGVAKEYLWSGGKSGGAARANALVATEPGQKRFERRQRLTQRILQDMASRVFTAAGLMGDDAEIEFVFPSIAVEERSAALKDIAFTESQGWISKKTAATMAARSLDIDTFDFESEQDLIAEEFEHTEDDEPDNTGPEILGPDGKPIKKTKGKQGDGVIRRPMMNAQYRQSPKLDPTKASSAEDQPPGLLMPNGMPGESEDGSPGVQTDPRAPGRSGFPGDENPTSSAGAANIRKDNLRESDRVVRVAEVAIREAYRAAARVPRRRPDDPSFQALAGEYRDEADRHARELVASVHPAATE